MLAPFAACGGEDRPPPFVIPGTGGGSGGSSLIDAGFNDGPPSPDAELCGNLVIPVIVERPNLYFVIDRSGSMEDGIPGSKLDKYQSARLAIRDVLQVIGHRVNYGAAVYPFAGGTIEGCNAGGQVFPTVAGDPGTYAKAGKLGPTLTALLNTLAQLGPWGGTPTSATLTALAPTLKALPGKTFVVLATDGGPNCNANTSCTAGQCIPNIEGLSLNGVDCTPSFNCCDSTKVPGGQLNCLDASVSELAVLDLAQAGIATYVVGMPGSEAYAAVLDKLALAGGTARPAPPLYYQVADASALSSSLQEIGVQVAISCTVDLDTEPPDPKLVNVYFDTTLVPSSDVDGWKWTGPTQLELVGPACDTLKSGDVIQVQVVAGCPTEVR